MVSGLPVAYLLMCLLFVPNKEGLCSVFIEQKTRFVREWGILFFFFKQKSLSEFYEGRIYLTDPG